MKRIIFVIVLCLCIAGQCFSEERSRKAPVEKDVGVLGVYLGKTLHDVGLKDGGKHYTPGYPLFVQEVPRDISVPPKMYVTVKDCDKSPAYYDCPVEEITLEFFSDQFSDMLKLAKNKFGKPHHTHMSTVQSVGGAKVKKYNVYWLVSGHSVLLTNVHGSIGEGKLYLTHKDKVKRDAEAKNKDRL